MGQFFCILILLTTLFITGCSFEGSNIFKSEMPPQDDMTRAWWEKSAAQGNATAQAIMGSIYYNGHGVQQDYAKAFMWNKKAAEQGNSFAQASLGSMYYKGHGVQRDYAKARTWWEKAAAQGNVEAQVILGFIYYKGHSVPQDYAKAQSWWEKAAAQGNVEAQNLLGKLYLGKGMPQKVSKSAKHEDAFAQDAIRLKARKSPSRIPSIMKKNHIPDDKVFSTASGSVNDSPSSGSHAAERPVLPQSKLTPTPPPVRVEPYFL